MVSKKAAKSVKSLPRYEISLVKYLDGRKPVLYIANGKTTEKIVLH